MMKRTILVFSVVAFFASSAMAVDDEAQKEAVRKMVQERVAAQVEAEAKAKEKAEAKARSKKAKAKNQAKAQPVEDIATDANAGQNADFQQEVLSNPYANSRGNIETITGSRYTSSSDGPLGEEVTRRSVEDELLTGSNKNIDDMIMEEGRYNAVRMQQSGSGNRAKVVQNGVVKLDTTQGKQ